MGGMCLGCTSNDCGECQYCKDKPKFGGPGKKKQFCKKQKCLNVNRRDIPSTLDTMINVKPSTSKVSHITNLLTYYC